MVPESSQDRAGRKLHVNALMFLGAVLFCKRRTHASHLLRPATNFMF